MPIFPVPIEMEPAVLVGAAFVVNSQEYFIAEAAEKVRIVKEEEEEEKAKKKDAFEAMKPQESELEDDER